MAGAAPAEVRGAECAQRPQFQHKTGRPQMLLHGAWAGSVQLPADGHRRVARATGAIRCGARFGWADVRNEALAAVPRLSVRGGHHPVHGRRGRRRRPDVAFLQGPAGLFAAAGLRAAGDDARARGRRLAGRRICQRAPALYPDPGGAEAGHQRLPRRRGQEFLRAWRARFRRHRARGAVLRAELRLRPPPAGRLDHHPAGRQELPADQRSVVRRARSRKRCSR